MALDPNIALQVKPIEIVDPLASYGRVAAIQNAQNQNALAQYQLGAAQRAETRDVAKMNALAQAGTDPQAVANALLKSGDVAGYSAFMKDLATRRKDEALLLDTKLKQSRQFLDNVTTPEQYLAWHQANHADPILGPTLAARGITAEQTMARIQQALKTPGGFQELLNQSKLGVEKFAELNKPHWVDTGGKLMPMSGLTGQALPGVAGVAKTATPGDLLTNARALERLQFEKDKENKPVFNAAIGGFVTKPTAANPQGGFTPLAGVQETKDQQAAVRALRSAGYDPTTGEDNISKLIQKSTSGGAEALGSATLAFFGKTTEGRKAIAALEGTANQIATDLAGGKLGAGISNTDRDFIVSALGDVANPNKTAAERLAGWTAAKDRMVRAGLIPPPTQGAGAAKPEAAPPAGVDAAVWKVMTPEERALWQKK